MKVRTLTIRYNLKRRRWFQVWVNRKYYPMHQIKKIVIGLQGLMLKRFT